MSDAKSALDRYGEQQLEWQAIRDEMIAAGGSPSAYQVTLELRKRLLERGERMVTADDITGFMP